MGSGGDGLRERARLQEFILRLDQNDDGVLDRSELAGLGCQAAKRGQRDEVKQREGARAGRRAR